MSEAQDPSAAAHPVGTAAQLRGPGSAEPPARLAPDRGPADPGGGVEARGIDQIPPGERHGRPRELFFVWFSSNLAYLYILLGGSLVMLGLSVPQALVVLVAGNLFWVLVGLLAMSGPATGTASAVVMRAFFGVRGNRLVGSGLGWLTAVGYEAINLAITAFAGLALIETLGGDGESGPMRVGVLLVVSVATFTISIYGHAAIVRTSKVLTVGLALCLLVAGGYVVAGSDPGSYTPAGSSSAPLAVALIGFTVIASGPLSWLTGADYARYLPRSASRRAVAGWTMGGGFLAAVLLGLVGVMAGTAVDMADPQSSMKALMSDWFYPVFLVTVMVGTLANNVLTSYSSGLMLQAVGVRTSRARTVFVDAVLGGVIALYALFAESFLTALNNILALSVTYLGPIMAIYATDLVLRRNRYDGRELCDERVGAPFWYGSGIGWVGVGAFLTGTVTALLCVNTTLLTGPLSSAWGGADLAAVVGPLTAAGVYAALYRWGEGVRLRAASRAGGTDGR